MTALLLAAWLPQARAAHAKNIIHANSFSRSSQEVTFTIAGAACHSLPRPAASCASRRLSPQCCFLPVLAPIW